MSAFQFAAAERPNSQWTGPFSPARGKYSGFRFNAGRLGTWVKSEHDRCFWAVRDSPGTRALSDLVLNTWGGGRVLFLPNGFVIKPLPGDEERGQRVLLGTFGGSIVLEHSDGDVFDLSKPTGVLPGGFWPGPSATGLECAIDSTGALKCNWYCASEWGRDEFASVIHGPDARLAAGFRKARPGNSGGRVRITAHGHVITNRQAFDGTWTTLYVGVVTSSIGSDWEEWVQEPT